MKLAQVETLGWMMAISRLSLSLFTKESYFKNVWIFFFSQFFPSMFSFILVFKSSLLLFVVRACIQASSVTYAIINTK